MRSRRFVFPILAAGVALALWWCSPREGRGPEGSLAPKSRDVAEAPLSSRNPAMNFPAGGSAAPESPAGDFPLAATLNAPNSTIPRDLDALAQILDAWRTNFPGEGNPVGENDEITAALTGRNARQVALLPGNHPAINARGQLCDRWGTPFRFHQVSGEHMEIRSAGPDQKFGTADDAVWSPGS